MTLNIAMRLMFWGKGRQIRHEDFFSLIALRFTSVLCVVLGTIILLSVSKKSYTQMVLFQNF